MRVCVKLYFFFFIIILLCLCTFYLNTMYSYVLNKSTWSPSMSLALGENIENKICLNELTKNESLCKLP
jgi:hypothetical protein